MIDQDAIDCWVLQELEVSRPTSHAVKVPLPNCQNALLTAFETQNILNDDVHDTLHLEEE